MCPMNNCQEMSHFMKAAGCYRIGRNFLLNFIKFRKLRPFL